MMEDNVPGFIGYPITRDGKLYSRRIERSPYKFGKWHKLRLSKKARVKVKLYKDGRGYNLGNSRIYISKRLKVSRKTLYNFIHRIQIRNSLE